MPTVFESISDGFYTDFFEPDPEKRKDKIEAWLKKSTPVIQSAVENELRAYVDELLKDTWTDKGWKARAEKYYCSYEPPIRKKDTPIYSFIDTYTLHMDIKLLKHSSKDEEVIVGTLTPEVREKTNEAIEAAKTAIAKLEPPLPVALIEINLHENHTVEEAIPIAGEFLRDCYRDNVRQVRIIHGKGIGVLREAVREYLEKHKYIISKSISPADKDHGGEGATEANLVEFSIDKLN